MPIHNEKSRPGVKFSKSEKEAIIDEVARLDGFGHNQRRIAERIWEKMGIHISQVIVCYYLKIIRQRHREATLESRTTYVERMLKQIRNIRAEAEEAWELSKQPTKKVSKEQGSIGKGYIDKITKTREERLPASEYLRIIMECNKQERELLGLDEPVKTENKNLNLKATLPPEVWGELLQPPKKTPGEEIVQQIIREQRKKLQHEQPKSEKTPTSTSTTETIHTNGTTKGHGNGRVNKNSKRTTE